jgi:para-aminobenzoate synthetase component 1
MNALGGQHIPFLFVFDFQMQQPVVMPLNEIDPEKIQFSIHGKGNQTNEKTNKKRESTFTIHPPDFQQYEKAFNEVMFHLERGDSYLLNLTMPVKLTTDLGLLEIFQRNKAPYKLWIKDSFTVFSPEPFIKITEGKIFSYPMKGTIDADLPDAEKKLLADPKELAEHYTIVDLIRNDLNMVSKEVRVERFRYIEKIHTHQKNLLQTSSIISGVLPEDFTSHLGTIITKLLPAGSISGAPKKKTIEVILQTEQYNRGYYTGIFGVFDGFNLDSGVMIRFIEQTDSGLFFKAGGGITVKSKLMDEYNELLDKVYLPFA